VKDNKINFLISSYMYTDYLNELDADVEDLYTSADKYQMLDLMERCEEILCHQLNNENAVRLFRLAVLHGGKNLMRRAAKFIWENSYQLENMTELAPLWMDLYRLSREVIQDELKKIN
jgi:hypothetical protein